MASRIEAGITIEGSIRGEGELEVAGRLRGALTLAGRLVVEEGGIVEADVEATEIAVAGLLAGSVTAHESVQVLPGGTVEARVKAPRLLVDDGATFRGELSSQGRGAVRAALHSAPVRSAGALPRAQPGTRAGMTMATAPVEFVPNARTGSSASALRRAPSTVAQPIAVPPARTGIGTGASGRAPRPGFALPTRGSLAPAAAPRTEDASKASAPAGGMTPPAPPRMPTLPRGRRTVQRRGGDEG